MGEIVQNPIEEKRWQSMYEMGTKTAQRFNIKSENDVYDILNDIDIGRNEIKKGNGKILHSLKELR